MVFQILFEKGNKKIKKVVSALYPRLVENKLSIHNNAPNHQSIFSCECIMNRSKKACLGIVLENHNSFHQLGLSSLPIPTKLNLLWMGTKSSDLAGYQTKNHTCLILHDCIWLINSFLILYMIKRITHLKCTFGTKALLNW